MPTTFTLTDDPMIAIRNDGIKCRTDLPYYQAWVTNGGVPVPYDSKTPILNQARELREKIFLRLNGIQQELEWSKARGTLTAAEVDPQVDGIMTAKAGLKDITTYATIVAATTGAETTAALKVRYAQLVAALYAASPCAYTAFNGLDV